MSIVPDNLLFTKSHEWIKEENGVLTLGISDYAQSSLGDIVFVDMKSPGTTLAAGDSLGTIESVKAAEDVYSPVSGTVDSTNDALAETPELVNQEPYEAWMIRLKDYDASALGELMDSAQYREYLATLES